MDGRTHAANVVGSVEKSKFCLCTSGTWGVHGIGVVAAVELEPGANLRKTEIFAVWADGVGPPAALVVDNGDAGKGIEIVLRGHRDEALRINETLRLGHRRSRDGDGPCDGGDGARVWSCVGHGSGAHQESSSESDESWHFSTAQRATLSGEAMIVKSAPTAIAHRKLDRETFPR